MLTLGAFFPHDNRESSIESKVDKQRENSENEGNKKVLRHFFQGAERYEQINPEYQRVIRRNSSKKVG